jgi:eukaryotic-like serine/threonine-protein kinase
MKEESLFEAALKKPSTAERHAFLEEACAGDGALRRRLERLLAAAEHTRGILEYSPGPDAADSWQPQPPLAADCVFAGRYELRQRLGAGGMGEVWVADQIQPVRRRVALKVVRTGLGSARTLARFDQERQALALMDHPNIAKVFDAGIDAGPLDHQLEVTRHESDGPIPRNDAGFQSARAARPYVVMELIEGESITDYCDRAKLSPRKRLELFIPVCQAVQHAHQKGIIHRDLKPSNILVGLYDGKPVPKVIDFGIAKTTGPRLTEQSVVTEEGAVIGTLEYMSPEQAELDNLDIDTRSDVYALGVVLYELLTGTTPLQRARVKDAGLWELLRMIREVEPPRPSLRLSTTEELPSIAANRGLEPKQLNGLVRGELDWIVMKCLEKDRQRRYQTANDLAMDLERYLADLPVEASPPSAAYRLRKFLRRHRGPVAAASITFIVLAGGIIGTSIGLKLASDRLTLVEAEKQRADEERSIAQAVDNFLQKDLLGQADIANQSAAGTRNPNITVRELLDRAAHGLGTRFQGQERTEAAIHLTLGRAYRALGEYPEAQKQMERSMAIRQEKLGPTHADTLDGMQNLAGLAMDRGEHGEAQRLYQQVLEIRRNQRGPDDPDTLQSMNDLGLAYLARGQFDKAESLLRDALDARRARLGPDHRDTLESVINLADLRRAREQYDQAEPLFKQGIEGWRAQLGPDHPRTLMAMNNLAGLYIKWGQYDKAQRLLDEVLETRRSKRGPDHPETLQTLHDLGVLYQMRGEYTRAETAYKQVLASRRARPGSHHPDALATMQQLASVYLLQRRPDQAEPLFKEVLAAQRATQTAGHPETIITMGNLGVLYRDIGRDSEAEPLLQEALARSRETNGFGHPTTHTIIAHLATLHKKQGTPHVDEPLLRELVGYLRDHPGQGSYLYANELGGLSENLLAQKKYTEAEPFARDCLAIRSRNKPDGWTTFFTKAMVGHSLLGQKKFADAEPFLIEGYTGMKEREAKIPAAAKVELTKAGELLVELYNSWGRPEKAAEWRTKIARPDEPNPKP